MVYISSNFPYNIQEGSDNSQVTIEKLTAPTIATLSMITNQTDVVAEEQHINIGGWK